MANDVGRSAGADGLSQAEPEEVSALRASIPSALEAIMTELGDLWYSYVCQDHHKDKDCHFSVSAYFSYGEPPTWSAEHNGYVGEFPRDKRSFARPEFPTYELALADCVNETLRMFRAHYAGLTTEAVERLKALSSEFASLASAIEARSDATAQTGAAVGESAGPKDDAQPTQRAEASNG